MVLFIGLGQGRCGRLPGPGCVLDDLNIGGTRIACELLGPTDAATVVLIPCVERQFDRYAYSYGQGGSPVSCAAGAEGP